MIQKVIFVCFILLLTVNNAIAQESCSDDNITSLDDCLTSAISSCQAAAPGCSVRATSIEKVESRTLKKCCAKANKKESAPDKKKEKKFNACRKSIVALAKAANRASRKVYESAFTKEAIQAIKKLKYSDCDNQN